MQPLDPWNVMPDRSVLDFLGPGWPPDSLTMWLIREALGHTVSVLSMKELKTARWTATQALCDQASIWTLESQVSFPGWQYSVHTVTHWCWESHATHNIMKKGWLKLQIWNFLDAVHELPPLTDFMKSVRNCNHEYRSFQWVPWILPANYQNWKCFWGPPSLQLVRSEIILVQILFPLL